MTKKFKIGVIAGIDIFLHWSFALLIVGIFGFYLYQGSTLSVAAMGVALILAVFVCVVLHELGHALTARRYAIPTKDITIYPIGGVARLQRIPEEPMKEFWIAMGGPAVNMVLAVLFGGFLISQGETISTDTLADPNGNFIATLMWLNVFLFAFNLLPAFPMDGGRVLRALLATKIEYARATQIAANVGQTMAIFFGMIGLFFNPVLLFIAVFVFFGAREESQQAAIRVVTRGVPVRQAMLTRFTILSPDDTLDVAIEELMAGSDQDFPVVKNGDIVGVLTRKQMMHALAHKGRSARVGDVIDKGCITIEDTAMLEEAFSRIQESQCTTMPVLRRGELVGLLTLENVGELMMISTALREASGDKNVQAVIEDSLARDPKRA